MSVAVSVSVYVSVSVSVSLSVSVSVRSFTGRLCFYLYVNVWLLGRSLDRFYARSFCVDFLCVLLRVTVLECAHLR